LVIDAVKLAIVSDIHANLEALQAVLSRIAADGADRIVCLGDVVGYHANPAECLALLRELNPVWVAGSHERALTGQITMEDFSATASRSIEWTRARLGKNILHFLAELPPEASLGSELVAVHGALHPEVGRETVRLDSDERRRLSLEALVGHPSGAHICAFGHTHRLGVFELRDGSVSVISLAADEAVLRENAYYLINPGAVGEPRGADRRATYMLLDTSRRIVSLRRVEYDYASAIAKTRKAGLLPRFWFLPAPVRGALKRAKRKMSFKRH
jgi:predicted phosphodiesterase